jgi:CubicO group peptidase (beta-lactamase class C family)
VRLWLIGCSAVLALAAVGAASPAWQPQAVSPEASRIDRVMRAEGIQGSVLVARRGTVLLSKGYGLADRARGLRNGPRTQFRITWLADQLTDVALLQLHERGRIDLDASVCRYVPRCPSGWRRATVRDLQRYRFHLASPGAGRAGSLAAAVDRLRRIPLVRGPKGNLRDLELVKQYLVERVTGMTWMAYVRASILRPAGMGSTVYEDAVADGTRAVGYSRGRPVTPPDATRTPSRADGIRSTTTDLYRYDLALSRGRLLSSASLDAMQRATPGSFIRGYFGVWQYGWLVGRFDGHVVDGQNAHGEAGWSTMLMRFPDDGVTVLVFLNESRIPFDAAHAAARIALA